MVKILKSPGLYIDCKDHWKVGEKCGIQSKMKPTPGVVHFWNILTIVLGLKISLIYSQVQLSVKSNIQHSIPFK